jgi:hypothetical protein
MRCGAPAITPSVSAQAGNARPRFLHCRITAFPNWLIVFFTLKAGEKTKFFG